jgi:autotransporter-associated beta strand protein
MKTKFTLRHHLIIAAASSLFAISSASAQTYTWDISPGTVGAGNGTITGGTGTWNTTNGNWTTDAGANNVAWDNTSPSVNTALFNANGIAGTGTVTLGETINLKALTFSNLRNSGPVQKYTITGGTLAFSSGATITTGTSLDNVNNAEYASINSAITGAPNVSLSWSGGNNTLVFAPTSGSQALGTATGPGIVKLAGSTTGNTIVGLNASSNGKLRMSSGTWTLTGTATGYEHWIEGGTLIISGSGSLQNNNRATNFSAGTLHWNTAGAIKDNSISTLRDRDFNITGGSIDNTSGGAITSSHNPQMVWGGNWTFIGSNGANSNLNMGTGQVFLSTAASGNVTRQVTVTNADTTLTIGGVLQVSSTGTAGLTKAGAGTLELRGASTYTGATTVAAGVLAIAGTTGSINSTSGITVAAGGTLRYNSSTALTKAPTLSGTGTGSGQRAVLGGTGPINAAVTLDNTGDVLSPGNSPGIQNYTVGQSWSSFSYDWEINNFTGTTAGTDFDQIVSGSTLDLTGGSGSYILNVLGLTAGNVAGLVPNFSEIDRSWTILTSTGLTGFNAANWTINTDGFTDPDAGTWELDQDGNNLVLSYTAIPEPATALLGGLGLLALLRRRR